MAALAVIFGGDSVLPVVGFPPPFPQWYEQIRANRLGSAATVWIVGNVMHGSLASTGAFELVLDGRTLFSKLAEGRMPHMNEIIALVDEHMLQGNHMQQ
ncbi:hypothetical protein CLOM_g9165 [Closterium sp. NIES-68]|nr:hypothetical protein CLOM_g9165 [Closterium sp. NIES-68]GJP77568.1 hypothetical protein CLOP_g7938 [Closterium sp. NIES-67]